MLTKKFFCPTNAWDYPYFKEDGSCSMVDDGDNPVMECDDAAYFWDEEQPDCFVWVDENGKYYEVDELLEQGYHIVNDTPVKLDDTVNQLITLWKQLSKSVDLEIIFEDGKTHRVSDPVEICWNHDNVTESYNPTD